MSVIDWALSTERGAGRGSSFGDIVNRPLRTVLTVSGLDPDAAFPGFVVPGLATVGPIIIGTDPGGADKLRIGGGVTIGQGLTIQAGSITITNDDTATGFTGTKYTNTTGTGSGFTYRGRAASGTKAVPGPTKAGQVIVNFTGHPTPDGVSFFGHCELIYLATQDHDATHRGTKITIGITPHNDVIRYDAWKFSSIFPEKPHFTPNDGFDNLVDVGVFGGFLPRNIRAASLISVGRNAGPAGVLQVDGPVGNVRDLIWTTNNLRRWHLRANTGAEGGADAGSDLVLRAYADDGTTTITDIITITRAAGGSFNLGRPTIWSPDNTNDLGQAAAFRPRTGYFGTSVVVGTAAAGGILNINGPAGVSRDLIWTTAGVRRWHMRANTGAEGGGNAGSDFVLRAYADDGATPVADVLTITRSTGAITCGGSVNLVSGRVLSVAGLQVVGARRTGWTAWTGTPTRTTFATSTATLQNVAEALKAVLDDLIAHGLIGT